MDWILVCIILWCVYQAATFLMAGEGGDGPDAFV